MARLKFGSLFSGCGGFDLGFMHEGFVPLGAYELDAEALGNFSRNVCSGTYRTDLTDGIPNESILRGIDALIAGPPCQGFSTAGKRQVDDSRNTLLPLTGHLALRVRPRVLVVENVAGAMSGEHAKHLDHLGSLMRLGGYRTHIIRVRATDVGMAQLRRRVMFFAWNTGKEISFSIQTQPPRTLRETLSGIDRLPNHHPLRLATGSKDWSIAKRIRPGQKLSNVRGGANAVPTWDIPEVFGEVTENERTILELLRRLRRQERSRRSGDADPVSMDRLQRALGRPFQHLIDSLIQKKYLRQTDHGIDLASTFNGKFRRLTWDGTCSTVDTRFGSPRYFLHPSESRGFTVREAARIQGFPDTYIFAGREQSQYRMLGNAVPPPLAALIARITRRLLGDAA